MSLSWRVIDFCRHFDIDLSAVSDSAGDAAVPSVFSQLALKFHVPLDAAATRLRQQNIVDFHLEEEGVIESDEIALGILTGKPISCNRTELRKYVSQFLSNRRCFSTTVANPDKSKSPTDSVPLVGVDGCGGAEEQRKKLISAESSLFAIAVDLARKEEELHQYESGLEVRSRELRETEDNFRQTMETVKLEIHNREVAAEEKRTALLTDSATLEERRMSLEQMEADIKNRLGDLLVAEKTLAAAQVQLQAGQEKLILEQTALRQDREQCASVAEGLLLREKRIREAEEKLVKTKNELIAYEDSLCNARPL